MDAEQTLSGNRPETSLQIWGQLLSSLRQIGFAQAGPEYLKLARLVAESRKQQLLTGRNVGSIEDWSRLSSIAAEVRLLLGPMVEAAGILADLPTRIAPLGAPPAATDPTLVRTTTPKRTTSPRATGSGAPRKAAKPVSANKRKPSKPVEQTQNKEKT